MNSHDEIQVSQILYCNNGDTVFVVSKTDETITVEYRKQLYTRPISIIGDKLHIDIPSAGTLNSQKAQKGSTINTNPIKREEEKDQHCQAYYHGQPKQRTPEVNKTFIRARRMGASGSWISDYKPQYPQDSGLEQCDNTKRSAEFWQGTTILGNNRSSEGPRPSTVTGYKQEFRFRLISKKRKRK